jgi:hypothetical protein
VQRRWPANAEDARRQTIDSAKNARSLLNDARRKLYRQAHPAEIALDIADAVAILADIERMMTEAKVGID